VDNNAHVFMARMQSLSDGGTLATISVDTTTPTNAYNFTLANLNATNVLGAGLSGIVPSTLGLDTVLIYGGAVSSADEANIEAALAAVN
jgi:hypothetical protein